MKRLKKLTMRKTEDIIYAFFHEKENKVVLAKLREYAKDYCKKQGIDY